MNKEFIPYEQALELKELGFDEHCMGACYYEFKDKGKTYMLLNTPDSYDSEEGVKAPLYQQAFRWFREKYGLFSQFAYFHVPKWTYSILEFTDVKITPNQIVSEHSKERTYEEAELECLKKLIEIAKGSNK